jgi:hypothetical protein
MNGNENFSSPAAYPVLNRPHPDKITLYGERITILPPHSSPPKLKHHVRHLFSSKHLSSAPSNEFELDIPDIIFFYLRRQGVD